MKGQWEVHDHLAGQEIWFFYKSQQYITIQKILPLNPYSEPVRELYLELGLHNIMIIHRMTVTQNKVQQMVFILIMWLLAKPVSSEIQLHWGTCVQITLTASISTFLMICHHNKRTQLLTWVSTPPTKVTAKLPLHIGSTLVPIAAHKLSFCGYIIPQDQHLKTGYDHFLLQLSQWKTHTTIPVFCKS